MIKRISRIFIVMVISILPCLLLFLYLQPPEIDYSKYPTNMKIEDFLIGDWYVQGTKIHIHKGNNFENKIEFLPGGTLYTSLKTDGNLEEYFDYDNSYKFINDHSIEVFEEFTIDGEKSKRWDQTWELSRIGNDLLLGNVQLTDSMLLYRRINRIEWEKATNLLIYVMLYEFLIFIGIVYPKVKKKLTLKVIFSPLFSYSKERRPKKWYIFSLTGLIVGVILQIRLIDLLLLQQIRRPTDSFFIFEVGCIFFGILLILLMEVNSVGTTNEALKSLNMLMMTLGISFALLGIILAFLELLFYGMDLIFFQ